MTTQPRENSSAQYTEPNQARQQANGDLLFPLEYRPLVTHRSMSGRGAPPHVTRFVRHLMDEMLAAGTNKVGIAKRIGVTKGTVTNIFKHSRGVGFETIAGLERANGWPIGDLTRRAALYAIEHPEPIVAVEKADRYPARAKGIQSARFHGLSEQAIRNVQAWAFKGAEGKSDLDWLDDIRGEVKRLEREALTTPDAKTAAEAVVAEEFADRLVRSRADAADAKAERDAIHAKARKPKK